MYSTYEEECEANVSSRDKILVLGGGPNRIGQGIEFDYCCVHAALAMREDGYETIMVNCNPETVSTDYDTSDRLYFEPVTLEDVLSIVDLEKPKGVIVQFGGQTPLKLARDLEAAGVPIIGTSPEAIDRAEDRERFQQMIHKLGCCSRPIARPASRKKRCAWRGKIGYPLVVRPSYVLGGRAMEIVYRRKICAAICARRSRFPTIHRCCWIAFSMMRWKSMWMRSATGGGHHRRHHGAYRRSRVFIPAIRPVPCRPIRSVPLVQDRLAGTDAGYGAGTGRDRADERPVRHSGR
jgi:carbamoylphosphate synthase large subunit